MIIVAIDEEQRGKQKKEQHLPRNLFPYQLFVVVLFVILIYIVG